MRHWMIAGVLAGALSLGACGGGRGYYVRTPPPPLRVEVYGNAPGGGYVWIQGNWQYGGNDYVWSAGRWDRPPRGRSRWEPGRWENRNGAYRWRDGRWR